MTTQEIVELAGHRDVPPWVMKLVADCVARERDHIAIWLESKCDEQFLADRVRSGELT